MKIFRTPFLASGLSIKKQLAADWLGVTIGNFDGMHTGHQSLFKFLNSQQPGAVSAATVLMSFYPHPRVFFNKSETPNTGLNRINSIRERIELARRYNFDAFFFARFNNKLAQLTAEQFVVDYIVKGLEADLVVVGDDWKFGKSRSGDVYLLAELGNKFGFKVIAAAQHQISGQRVSSSRVKEALIAGDLRRVESLLARRYSITGKVRRGAMRGRTIGFPTANLYPSERILPKYGVYAVEVTTPFGRLKGVTNVGVRPTVFGQTPSVETHIFSEQPLPLYDKYITIEFIRRIRDEKKFNSLQELSLQIARDCEIAREVLDE